MTPVDAGDEPSGRDGPAGMAGAGGGPAGEPVAADGTGGMPGGEEAVARAVLDQVVRWLAARARTEREIRDRLGRRQVPEAVVERVLERLRRWGYVDDRRLAGDVAEGARARGIGPRRLRADLARRGVPDALADEAVRAAWPPGSQWDAAWELARRRWARLMAAQAGSVVPQGDEGKDGVEAPEGGEGGQAGSGAGGGAEGGGPEESDGCGGLARHRAPGRFARDAGGRRRAAGRLYRYLLGRGFSPDVVRDVVRRLAGDEIVED